MATTLAAEATALNADVVACCPYESCEHLIALGCYELIAAEERRIGRLALLSTRGDALSSALCAVDGTGVLDCAWLPPRPDGAHLLALATSEGTAQLYSLATDDGAATAELVEVGSMACEGAGDACMSLAWSDAPSSRLALTSTTGMVSVGELESASGSGGALRLLSAWQAHDLEGWAVAFGHHDEHTLYTGADDAMLKRWDLRSAADGEPPAATASNRRSHRAGVCCLSPHPTREHLLASGSYDESVRLWDMRQLRSPLGEHGCGGGVWRLKWHPSRADVLLAACMHAGFAVLKTAGGEVDESGGEGADGEADAPLPCELEALALYEAHGLGAGGLGYGADWRRGAGADGAADVAATCSFYDRALHLWSVSL